MSATRFTDTQGQYLAFIDAYTRVHGRPRPRPTCSAISGSVRPPAPDGAHAGAPRPDRPPARGGAQHRGAPRPRRPARPPPSRTRQILCAEELVLTAFVPEQADAQGRRFGVRGGVVRGPVIVGRGPVYGYPRGYY